MSFERQAVGKRGPKPGEPKAVLSTRIGADTRAALEAAAKARGKPLSWEIERRLKRSFDEDAGLVERLGGRELYAILRMIAAAMSIAGAQAYFQRHARGTQGRPDWLNDPYAYDQAVRATVAILESLRPPGDPKMPFVMPGVGDLPGDSPGAAADRRNYINRTVGERAAWNVVDEVALAPPDEPSPTVKLPKHEVLARRLAVDLGAARDHLVNTDDLFAIERRKRRAARKEGKK